MLIDRVADPQMLSIEVIRNNPSGAADRMKTDQEKIVRLQAEIAKLKSYMRGINRRALNAAPINDIAHISTEALSG